MRGAMAATMVLLATALAVSPAFGAGKVVVAADEWPLSDYGYRFAPDTERFAQNLAAFFTGSDRPGRFLVYSTNWGLGGDRLATTMRAAGHTWTLKNPATAPNEDFSKYDAVFVGQTSVSAHRLTDYVNAGGHVYVVSGTGYGGADTSWNTFLAGFGLQVASRTSSRAGVVPIHSSHPLFDGVAGLLVAAINPVSVFGDYPGSEVIASAGSDGLFGVFTAVTLPLAIRTAACGDDVKLRRVSTGTLNAAVYGTVDVSSTHIDLASVRLLDVRPLSSRIKGPRATVTPVVCVDRLDGFEGEPLRFDSHSLSHSIWSDLGNTVVDGEVVVLTLSGRLKPEHGGGAIRAHDTVILRTH